ncbi:MAG: nucleoside hydrolase [Ruminococcaceae bacterium]|nr:nucleoside hydrolase [Oscillospiraceae bacterium]
MTEAQRVAMLEPPKGKVSIILDTDTACEVDDQFALSYAVRAAQDGQLVLEGIHATLVDDDPADGMERSYQEILKVLKLVKGEEFIPKARRGSKQRMVKGGGPIPSEAADHLIEVAMDESREGPLYVVAIGAGTNIASALMMKPEIKEKIVVVWLAGNSLHWHDALECNFIQDIAAAQYILDCGVPLTLMPAWNVIAALVTSIYELEHYLDGKSEIASYLVQNVRNYIAENQKEDEAWSQIIWDIAGIGYIIHPEWFDTRLVPTPMLTDGDWEHPDVNWASNPTRHLMRIGDFVRRDPLYMDVFRKIGRA